MSAEREAEPCDFTGCGYCSECRDPSKEETPDACPTCPDPRCADYGLCTAKTRRAYGEGELEEENQRLRGQLKAAEERERHLCDACRGTGRR